MQTSAERSAELRLTAVC